MGASSTNQSYWCWNIYKEKHISFKQASPPHTHAVLAAVWSCIRSRKHIYGTSDEARSAAYKLIRFWKARGLISAVCCHIYFWRMGNLEAFDCIGLWGVVMWWWWWWRRGCDDSFCLYVDMCLPVCLSVCMSIFWEITVYSGGRKAKTLLLSGTPRVWHQSCSCVSERETGTQTSLTVLLPEDIVEGSVQNIFSEK